MDVLKNSAFNMLKRWTCHPAPYEVRDALGDLAAIVYKDVVRVPIVQEADNCSGRQTLIAA